MEMNLKIISLTFILAASISQPAYTAPFSHTQEYLSFNKRSYQLQGRNFRTDPAFTAYCEKYARVANRQAQRRLNQCRNRIPLKTENIRVRWSRNYQGHRNWCNNVSSNATGVENRVRESQLRNCIASLPTTRLTRQQCTQNDKFHKSAARANINFVRRCLDIGIDVNRRENSSNWTALHSAARNGRLNIVRLLLQRGAYINARDYNNRTPLDQAQIANQWAVVNYLSDHGAVARN